MMGMDDVTGKSITEMERIRRSIRDIILTPVGSRVLKRDYGSHLIRLLDAPINSSLRVSVAESVISAIRKWEPRVKVTRVEITGDELEVKKGKVQIHIYYIHQSRDFVESVGIR